MSKNRANAVDFPSAFEETATNTLESLIYRAEDAASVCHGEADHILATLVSVDGDDGESKAACQPAALPRLHRHVDQLTELAHKLRRIHGLLTDEKVSTKADR